MVVISGFGLCDLGLLGWLWLLVVMYPWLK